MEGDRWGDDSMRVWDTVVGGLVFLPLCFIIMQLRFSLALIFFWLGLAFIYIPRIVTNFVCCVCSCCLYCAVLCCFVLLCVLFL